MRRTSLATILVFVAGLGIGYFARSAGISRPHRTDTHAADLAASAAAGRRWASSSSRRHRYSRGLPRPEVPGLRYSLGSIFRGPQACVF
jgi:hypothetical protein